VIGRELAIEQLATELFDIAVKGREPVLPRWPLLSEPTRVVYRGMAAHALAKTDEQDDVDIPRELAAVEGLLTDALLRVGELMPAMAAAAKQAAAVSKEEQS